jgi:hypothetical protein
MRPSVIQVIVLASSLSTAAALAVPPRSTGEGSRSSFSSKEEQRKRRRDSRREEEEPVATRPDSMNEGITTCSQTRIVFARLTYRPRSNSKHRVTCILTSTRRIILKSPLICSETVGSSSRFGSSATTLGPKDNLEKSTHLLIQWKEGQHPMIIRQNHTYQKEETCTYQPKCSQSLADRSA